MSVYLLSVEHHGFHENRGASRVLGVYISKKKAVNAFYNFLKHCTGFSVWFNSFCVFCNRKLAGNEIEISSHKDLKIVIGGFTSYFSDSGINYYITEIEENKTMDWENTKIIWYQKHFYDYIYAERAINKREQYEVDLGEIRNSMGYDKDLSRKNVLDRLRDFRLLINGRSLEIIKTSDSSFYSAINYNIREKDVEGTEWTPFTDPDKVPSVFKWVGNAPKNLEDAQGPDLHCRIVLFEGKEQKIIKDFGKKVILSRGSSSICSGNYEQRIIKGEYVVEVENYDKCVFTYKDNKLYLRKVYCE